MRTNLHKLILQLLGVITFGIILYFINPIVCYVYFALVIATISFIIYRAKKRKEYEEIAY